MPEGICSIDDCESKVLSRGWCVKHYARWRTHGDPMGKPPFVQKMCSVEDCERVQVARGWCYKHWARWSKYGDPVYVAPAKPTVCSVDGCELPLIARGWCAKHRARWMHHGSTDSLLTERGEEPPPCTVEGCMNPGNVGGFGWCTKHLQRNKRHGNPLTTSRIVGDDVARFWSYVDLDGPIPDYAPDLGPCWIWTGSLSADGYAVMGIVGGSPYMARWSYERFVEPIAPGLEPDHLCRVPACVNFERHLEPVTHKENILRGMSPQAINARKTHCIRGHEFTPENTIVTHSRGPGRMCRTCYVEAGRARYRKA